jgi:hypothetical protein
MPYVQAGPEVISPTHSRIGDCTRRFGVELEVSEADNWTAIERSRDLTVFGVKSDGSVNGDGLEFYSPILSGDAGLEAVDNLCGYAANNGWFADESCGYHLHIDCGDLNGIQKKRIYYAYKLTEDLWRRFVPQRRVSGCCYCREIPIEAARIREMRFSEIKAEVRRGANHRYVWCNLLSLENHRTIEIRLHDGTVEAEVVSNWIKAHVLFIDRIKDRLLAGIDRRFKDKTIAAQFTALERLWGDAELSAFYRRRAKRVSTALHL